ncbi:TetR family transcriptional regulator [Fodinicola feengrottensis]|uniref:TetR family transcriptional regulator n=1 Tax=Fodinicola feengrottensis TaxID=435914 RepID=A0ABN2HWH4_9ACTN
MDMEAVPKLGLRERKKQETRSALSWAAVRLSVERGLDHVLVEDIAAEAGVSARTFNNYFSSKAEAIASRHVDRVRMIAAGLREQPAGQPLWEAISDAVFAQFGSSEADDRVPDQRWTAGVQLMTDQPTVRAELLRGSREAERDLAAAVAERLKTDPLSVYPQLVAAAVGIALQVAMEGWLRADPPELLAPLLRKSLEQVANLSEQV